VPYFITLIHREWPAIRLKCVAKLRAFENYWDKSAKVPKMVQKIADISDGACPGI
jgi:hypothetical protein